MEQTPKFVMGGRAACGRARRVSKVLLAAVFVFVLAAAPAMHVSGAAGGRGKKGRGGTPSTPSIWSDAFTMLYTLVDGQISPDSKWACQWTGYGEVRTESLGDNIVMALEPQTSFSPDVTHAPLVTTNQAFANHIIDLDVRTVQQTRQGSAPNTWEVAWVLFRMGDLGNCYYFLVKPNGAELGKLVGGSQVFLATTDSPQLTIGQWNHWTIKTVGNQVTIWVDGVAVIDHIDYNAAPIIQSGVVGLYNEDARVHFDNVRITPL